MNRSIEHLIHVLQQCEELYHRMLSILELEKKAALAPNSSDLAQVNDEKEALLAQLKVLDRQRATLLEQIAGQLDVSADRLTLSALIEQVTPMYGSQLQTVYDALRRIVSKVQYANNESRLLITHCLALVKNTQAFFSRWTASAAVYGASGHVETNGRGYGRLLSNSV
jgi:flagellar biosynthesis/type III secretory pathway chaperone